MADYPINKGIGHSVEFKGLKAQYLFIFAGGLLAVFFLVIVLYMAGVDQLVCIGLGLTLGSLLVWGTFHLNNKYGEHGLMKLLAFPHWGLRFKSLEKMGLSKRKFVIRHACIQIQPPTSCRPCPFGAYGGKVEHKLLDSRRRR